jgi:hypothetical protein
MRTIIAGSRNIEDYELLLDAINASGFSISEILSGKARGVDAMGESYGRKHKIPLKYFPADWNKHGKSAGIRRNIEMAENADALIALWDGKSKGTYHMIETAKKKGLKVFVMNP